MIFEKSDSEPDQTGLKRNKMSLLKGTESVFASDTIHNDTLET